MLLLLKPLPISYRCYKFFKSLISTFFSLLLSSLSLSVSLFHSLFPFKIFAATLVASCWARFHQILFPNRKNLQCFVLIDFVSRMQNMSFAVILLPKTVYFVFFFFVLQIFTMGDFLRIHRK